MKEFWFWRDSASNEVDLISQEEELLDVIEIKATATVSQDLFKGLLYFEN